METLVFAILMVQLTVIALIDARRSIIPDVCNALLGLTGVAAHWLLGSFDVLRIVTGAVVFGGTFALARAVHFRARGQVGLGLGDVKMAAAAGCWITIASFPLFLAIASLSALLFVLAMLPVWKGALQKRRVPFGPFLALGLALSWLAEASSVSVLEI
ncbi:prepilin peptidase [Sinorhizobium fredii]|uniref:Prepilin peptidase n=2 Tax=Rhizobium fredii TaxID=380 RepID=A0A844AE36_RHIFR|nr:A24 family peptidase [Sinorhizobium fredii]ASY70281.1 Leader peptidase (Prepilin peptidase) [Sinorhizobium fredii CCBAU 83666]AWM26325.1 Leader peptidase (Prepilin peptidase) [Sinorhizobium fredii CCBAU 25509]MQW93594.1 prepilin peptidase [Sinorhizobium fredii]MQX11233.1 prepilin peptidase [Sinorhizobium fredii]UTY50394.1 prepilin peptidase [Sinorhizobium fredii]